MEDYKITQDKLKKAKGKIEKLTPQETDKGKKYGLILDSHEHMGIWFNGWGSAPAEIGDEIEFEFEEKPSGQRVFYNIKKILSIKRTSTSPTQEDQIQLNKIEPVNYPQNKETSSEWLKTLQTQNKTLLMKSTIDMCIARNDLSDQSIEAGYIRLANIAQIKLEEVK